MVGNLLLRGMLVGVLAGLLAFAFARTFGEPQVDRAIAYEEQMSAASAAMAEPELVSRATQAGLGLATGIIAYGAAVGGLLSLVFAAAYGRLGRLGARSTAALLALAGFIAIVVVPALKYPANPPAVGSDETIGPRTALYFVMLAISIAGTVGAFALARRLTASLGQWNAALAAGAAFVVFIAIVQWAMPSINEVPEGFSADLLWRFRVASFGIQAVLWTALGLGFGYLAERLLEPPRLRQQLAAR